MKKIYITTLIAALSLGACNDDFSGKRMTKKAKNSRFELLF